MSRTFNIVRDYHEEKQYIFKRKTCTFEPGLTVLVGCNGSGKSTLLQQICYSLKRDGIPHVFHDANKDDARSKRDEALFYDNIDFIATSVAVKVKTSST